MSEGEAASDQMNVSPGELEAVAFDAISNDGPPNRDAADDPQAEPVMTYCDRSALDLAARIRVFQKVCRVVHAAHQRGTIFGDLSAGRLRITAEGAVVIDDSTPVSTTSGPEEPGLVKRWTSPEQVLGEPATSASDVYALGVVLYELLTGRFPYQVDVGDPEALAKAISEQSAERPARPSRGRAGVPTRPRPVRRRRPTPRPGRVPRRDASFGPRWRGIST